MENNEAENLKRLVEGAIKQLDIKELANKLASLKQQSEASDFWSDNQKAREVMQEIAGLERRVNPWLELDKAVNELVELTELNDQSLKDELERNLATVKSQFDELKQQLMLSRPFDDHDAVLTISAGAGGTDAQDWTQMLFRMYSRFFDKKEWKCRVIEESQGEEAGLKSVVVEIEGGEFTYGQLKGEHG